jgi:CysZ protein
LRALLGGYRYLFKTPDIWPLAMVPTAVALVLSIIFSVIAWKSGPALVAALVDKPQSGAVYTVLYVVLQVLATVALVVLAIVMGFALGKPLSGPALEKLVRRVEKDLGAPEWPEPSLVQDILRSFQSTLVAAAFTVPIVVVLGVLGFFFTPIAVITFPLQLTVTAIGASWDLCDYPLSIRGLPIGERVQFVGRNIAAVLGFGFGLALLSLLPCTLLFVLPAGVLGAAELMVTLERWETEHKRLVG